MRARGAGVWVACEFECGVGDAGVGGVLRVGDVMKGKEGGAGDAGVGFGEGLGENGGDGGALGFDFGGGEGLLPPGRRRSRVERRRLPPEGRRSRGLEGSWGSQGLVEGGQVLEGVIADHGVLGVVVIDLDEELGEIDGQNGLGA